MRGQIVAAGFQEENVGMEFLLEVFQRQEVGGNILADGGVRAAARLYRTNAPGIQRFMADEKFRILLGENIVGHSGHTGAVAQTLTEREHQRGLAAAYRTAHANGESSLLEVPAKRLVAVQECARVARVFVGMAIGTVLMRVVAHKISGSTLKQARVETVLCSLPKVEQGRGLRYVCDGQVLALGKNCLRARGQPVLQCLPLHRPGNAQPDGSCHQSPQVLKEKQTSCSKPAHTQSARDRAEGRRKMAQWKTLGRPANLDGMEDSSGRGEERPALEAAGAVGHMIGEKTVANAVQSARLVRLVMSGGDKWQASVSELFQARFNERCEFTGLAHFTVLPCRLQAARVREGAGGECGVSQLPNQPVVVRRGGFAARAAKPPAMG